MNQGRAEHDQIRPAVKTFQDIPQIIIECVNVGEQSMSMDAHCVPQLWLRVTTHIEIQLQPVQKITSMNSLSFTITKHLRSRTYCEILVYSVIFFFLTSASSHVFETNGVCPCVSIQPCYIPPDISHIVQEKNCVIPMLVADVYCHVTGSD